MYGNKKVLEKPKQMSLIDMKIEITKRICKLNGCKKLPNGGYDCQDWQDAIAKNNAQVEELRKYYLDNWSLKKNNFELVAELYEENFSKDNYFDITDETLAKKDDKKITVAEVLSDKEKEQLGYFNQIVGQNKKALAQAGLQVSTVTQTTQIATLQSGILTGKFNVTPGAPKGPRMKHGPQGPKAPCLSRLKFLNDLCGVTNHLTTRNRDYYVYVFMINGKDWVVAESNKWGNAAYVFQAQPDPKWINQFGAVLLGNKGKNTWKTLPGFEAKIVHQTHDVDYQGKFTANRGMRPYWESKMLEVLEK